MAGYSRRSLVDKLGIKGGARIAIFEASKGYARTLGKLPPGVTTDLTEDVIRVIGLAHGLVDVKVAAVDEVWSGLKFVRRLKDR